MVFRTAFDSAETESSVESINDQLNESVCSDDLFKEGIDDIIFQGNVYKFHPGLSSNFIQRWVQISRRAFRYFKDRSYIDTKKPLVSFRKSLIKDIVFYKINKESYIKLGSKINKSQLEHLLFENVFEIELNADYEDEVKNRFLEVVSPKNDRNRSLSPPKGARRSTIVN